MKILTALIAATILCVLNALFDGWIVMLLLGWAHSMSASIPDFGYGPVFALVLALQFVLTSAKRTTTTASK